MRQIVQQVRALLRGERIPLAVTTSARALKLNVPPIPDLPIYLAALGDASVRLAGELADGWMPFIYPRHCLAEGVARLREGAAPRRPPERRRSVSSLAPGRRRRRPGRRREGAAWFVSFYLVSMGTLYRQSLARQGFGKEVEAVLAANAPNSAAKYRPTPRRCSTSCVVYGTPAQARRRLARWHEAGAELPVLLLRPNLSAEEIEFTLDALSPREATARA